MTSQKFNFKDLPLTALNPGSPIPLYQQIANDLRELINSGQLSAFDVLPPEKTLCQIYGVGRHTMRMAMAQLVNENLISRRAGSGTFIKPQDDRLHFYLDRSFTNQIEAMGFSASSRVLKTASGLLDQNAPPVLRRYERVPFFYLERLRFGNNEPIGLQESTILSERCPGIERYNFNASSLYDVLARDYKLFITQISHVVTAVTATRAQADMLKVVVDAPLLLVKTSAFIEAGQLIEYTVSYYRVDKYEYSTTHYAG
ncbi:MAG: transcriptional regulator NagR [Anaerolineae bacterium]